MRSINPPAGEGNDTLYSCPAWQQPDWPTEPAYSASAVGALAGGYSGALQNALDYLPPRILRHKPVGICTVSSTEFGGLQCLSQLRLVTLALGGLPLPNACPIPKVQDAFTDGGQLRDPQFDYNVQPFLGELVWYVEALVTHKTKR